jgi:HD-like signal output (HDOD) protein
MEFMRKKRSILKELKEKQKEERHALVETLGDLERLLIAQEFGYSSARQWVMDG